MSISFTKPLATTLSRLVTLISINHMCHDLGELGTTTQYSRNPVALLIIYLIITEFCLGIPYNGLAFYAYDAELTNIDLPRFTCIGMLSATL